MSLPQGFVEMIRQYPQLQILEESLLTEPSVSVRINPAKKTGDDLSNLDKVPWCREGYYLAERPQFTFDPKLHQGAYYVQDASSMAISEVISQLTKDTAPIRYLDACAAPGGKTTAALSALPEQSVVVANEYDYRRAEILAENLSKWGNPNVVVSRGDTSRFKSLPAAFDIVAVDAPCSGEGMMRKERQAREQWSHGLIKQCAATQREIIDNVWPALRPGGYLIYSTCTFNKAEDEDNLKWIIDTYGAEPVEIDSFNSCSEICKGLDTPYPCYRFIPGRVRGEGLFIAVLRKPGSGSISDVKVKAPKPIPQAKTLDNWFVQDMEYESKGDDIYAFPSRNATFIRYVSSRLDTILIGVHAAVIKGRDIIPTHELALSIALSGEAFTKCEIDYEQAISYLQRDNLTLASDTPKGFVLLTYKGMPLGMVKNLGNRANNLLPKPWRILTRHHG